MMSQKAAQKRYLRKLKSKLKRKNYIMTKVAGEAVTAANIARKVTRETWKEVSQKLLLYAAVIKRYGPCVLAKEDIQGVQIDSVVLENQGDDIVSLEYKEKPRGEQAGAAGAEPAKPAADNADLRNGVPVATGNGDKSDPAPSGV